MKQDSTNSIIQQQQSCNSHTNIANSVGNYSRPQEQFYNSVLSSVAVSIFRVIRIVPWVDLMLGLSDTALSSSSFCSCPWGRVPQLPPSDASPGAKCWGEGEVAACLFFFHQSLLCQNRRRPFCPVSLDTRSPNIFLHSASIK